MKDYTVEILSYYSHGRYGKTFYFGMIVSADNKELARSMVEELVNDMSDNEFFEWCTTDAQNTIKYLYNCRKPKCSYRVYVGC